MKSIFDAATRKELTDRINKLNDDSRPLWGKMTVYQMVKHTETAEEMFLGKATYKRTFPGLVFGKIALKNMLKDEKPMMRNAPTHPSFKVAPPEGDLAAEKSKWINLVGEYENFSNDNFVHWFFGKMTKEQIGQFAYKHNDHHLTQFGV